MTVNMRSGKGTTCLLKAFNLSACERTFITALLLFCRYNWTSERLAPIAALGANDTKEFLSEAAHTLEESFKSCIVFGVTQNCSNVLRKVPTDGGKSCFCGCRRTESMKQYVGTLSVHVTVMILV